MLVSYGTFNNKKCDGELWEQIFPFLRFGFQMCFFEGFCAIIEKEYGSATLLCRLADSAVFFCSVQEI